MPSHVGIGRATWASGTSVVVPIPAGAVAGDGIEVFAFCEGSTRTSSNAQGLTKIGQVVGASSFVIATYWKILVASDITRGTFTIAHSGGGSPTFAGGKSRAVHDVSSSAPIISMETAYDAGGTSHTANAVTTTRSNAFVSVIAMDTNGTLTFTPPSGWTEDEDQAGNAFFHVIKAATGSTGSISFTSTSGPVLCCTFAWQPPSVTYDESVALAADAGMSESRGLSLASALSLAAAGAITPASLATFARSLSLDIEAALAVSGGRTVDAAVGLTGVLAALVAARGLAIDGATSLDATADLAAIGSRGIDASVALDATASAAASHGVALSLSVALAASAAADWSPSVIADRVASLGASAGLSASRTSTLQASVALAIEAAFESSGGREVAGSVALAALADLAVVGSRGIDGAVTFAAQADASATAALTRAASLMLAATASLDPSRSSTMASSVAFAASAAVALARLSVMESALTLGATADLAYRAGAIYARQIELSVAATLSTLEDIGVPPAVIQAVSVAMGSTYARNIAVAHSGAVHVVATQSRAMHVTLT